MTRTTVLKTVLATFPNPKGLKDDTVTVPASLGSPPCEVQRI